jgi:hypothetical protein
MRSPSPLLVDSTFRPIFLPIVPERDPHTLWGCQPAVRILKSGPAGGGFRANRSAERCDGAERNGGQH